MRIFIFFFSSFVFFCLAINSYAGQGRFQVLPITAKLVVNDNEIFLEVAKTSKEKALGLMNRPLLPDNRGMLFQFSSPVFVSLWMKNCLYPLDMIFLENGVIRHIQINARPCKVSSCPSYAPNIPVNQIIELRGGRVLELGLKLGDNVSIISLGAALLGQQPYTTVVVTS